MCDSETNCQALKTTSMPIWKMSFACIHDLHNIQTHSILLHYIFLIYKKVQVHTYKKEDEISPLLNSFITCQLQKCTNYSENFIEKSSSHANGKKRKYAYLTHSKGSLRLLVLCPKTMQLATLSIESAKLAFFCSWMLMCGAIIIISWGSTHYIYIKKLLWKKSLPYGDPFLGKRMLAWIFILIVVGEFTVCAVDILFLSNQNIHKNLCGQCFWASDPLIELY